MGEMRSDETPLLVDLSCVNERLFTLCQHSNIQKELFVLCYVYVLSLG